MDKNKAIVKKGIINNFPKPPDFSHSFGIVCIANRKKRGNDRLKAILSSKVNLAQMQDLPSQQSPEKLTKEWRTNEKNTN